jgi:hypothetical protein
MEKRLAWQSLLPFFFFFTFYEEYMEVREIKQFKKDNSTSNIIFATHESHNRIRSHIP